MLLLSWLLSASIGGDVKALGSDSYECRERATANLAAFGWFARPLLLEAAQSSDPEIRSRAAALLGRQNAKIHSWRIVLIVSGLYEVPPCWWDKDTRYRVWWFIKSSGVDTCYPLGHAFEYAEFAPWRINPGHDSTSGSAARHSDPHRYYEAAMRFVRSELAAGRYVRSDK